LRPTPIGHDFDELTLDAETLLRQAQAEFAAGRKLNAERLCRRVLLQQPDRAEAKLLCAVSMAMTSRPAKALAFFEEVLAADPNSREATIWLALLRWINGEPSEATRHAKRAIELHPDDPLGYFYLGILLVEQGEVDAAMESLDRSLALGNLEREVYGWRDAAGVFESPSKAVPIDQLLEFGEKALLGQDAVTAQRAAAQAIARGPSSGAELLFAKALAAQGRMALAKDRLLASISRQPTASALAVLGLWEQASGEVEAAREHLEKSIQMESDQAAAYYYLGQISRGDASHLERVESLIASPILSPIERQLLCFTAAKTREELKDYAGAMARFDAANQLPSEHRQFDAGAFVAGYDRFIELFSGPLAPIGPEEETPIFIVGMIRSGTTLLEQILSSHPKIQAAGEVPFWVESAGEAVDFQTGRIDEAALRGLAHEYLAALRDIGEGRVTDKMPANASLLGLIHRALPKAKIIHIRRNPADTCLSIYTTRFDAPPPYAGSKSDIALAYRQNARIMAHWKSLIPSEVFTTVDYEDLVADREPVLRRLLAFLGLEWDDACLAHEQNKNTVQTPSLWRVRQAVDQASVSRWERFRPWLPEFEDLW
jgi:tetratricopeptide (TPR) repeat protein